MLLYCWRNLFWFLFLIKFLHAEFISSLHFLSAHLFRYGWIRCGTVGFKIPIISSVVDTRCVIALLSIENSISHMGHFTMVFSMGFSTTGNLFSTIIEYLDSIHASCFDVSVMNNIFRGIANYFLFNKFQPFEVLDIGFIYCKLCLKLIPIYFYQFTSYLLFSYNLIISCFKKEILFYIVC